MSRVGNTPLHGLVAVVDTTPSAAEGVDFLLAEVERLAGSAAGGPGLVVGGAPDGAVLGEGDACEGGAVAYIGAAGGAELGWGEGIGGEGGGEA